MSAMRIEDMRRKASDAGMSGDRGRRAASDVGGGTQEAGFAETFEEIELSRLLNEVRALGEQLTRFPSTTLLARYKALVKQLLKRAMDGLKVRRGFRWQRTERTLFVMVQRTESAVDELEALIETEGQRAQVLDLVEEIKGCLISILS